MRRLVTDDAGRIEDLEAVGGGPGPSAMGVRAQADGIEFTLQTNGQAARSRGRGYSGPPVVGHPPRHRKPRAAHGVVTTTHRNRPGPITTVECPILLQCQQGSSAALGSAGVMSALAGLPPKAAVLLPATSRPCTNPLRGIGVVCGAYPAPEPLTDAASKVGALPQTPPGAETLDLNTYARFR